MTHTHTASGKTTRTEVYTYTYDHADRISKVQHSLGSTAITLYDATYDNFGRLLTKQYHGTVTIDVGGATVFIVNVEQFLKL